MSDQIPDPVEDGLRRTFAARAEDMAPGDGAAAEDQALQELLAGPYHPVAVPRPGGRRPGRLLLAAAIVVIVGAALAAVGVVVTQRDDGDRDRSGDLAGEGDGDRAPMPVVVALVDAQRDLVFALEDERNLATLHLIGAEEVIALPVTDAAEARRRTDDAIAGLRRIADGGPLGTAFGPAVDALDGLDTLRSDVDADTALLDLSNSEAAHAVFDRYTRLVGGLLDAQSEGAATIEDPDVRVGVQLHQLGLRQDDLTWQLLRAALFNAIEPGTESLTELNQAFTRANRGLEVIRSSAAGTPYEDAATEVLGEVEASGLMDTVAAGLGRPESLDLAETLSVIELPPNEGWPAFLGRVEDVLAAQG